MVIESLLVDLNYLRLVVKEVLRLHPLAPLLLPRECRSDGCRVLGYDVPKGTKVFVNVWAMGRDHMYWGDAEAFRPERFENSTIDFKGADFEFLPFGAGRRMCPGVSYSLPFLQMALVQLCYHFDWSLPEGVTEVDRTDGGGLGLRRKSPLRLCAKPFVPESVYEV